MEELKEGIEHGEREGEREVDRNTNCFFFLGGGGWEGDK